MTISNAPPLEPNPLLLERRLVEKIQSGDTQAFRQLYDQYARLVYRYILLRINNPQDAEDLTAETFTRAWRAIAAFQWRETSIGAWLFRIAHNLIVDRFRQKRDVLTLLPWRHGQLEIKFDQVEQQDEIKTAFATLSTEQQMIVYLHFFEGYSLGEVASFLGKSPNAVTVAHFRALQRLRKALTNA